MEIEFVYPRNAKSSRARLKAYVRQGRVGIWRVGFCGGRKTGEPRENPWSEQDDENQQQTQPTFDARSGNRTRATVVRGERSHQCAIPAPRTTPYTLGPLKTIASLVCPINDLMLSDDLPRRVLSSISDY